MIATIFSIDVKMSPKLNAKYEWWAVIPVFRKPIPFNSSHRSTRRSHFDITQAPLPKRRTGVWKVTLWQRSGNQTATLHKPCSTKQCMNNVTLCRVRITTVATENETVRSQCTVGPQVCQQHRNIGSAAIKTQQSVPFLLLSSYTIFCAGVKVSEIFVRSKPNEFSLKIWMKVSNIKFHKNPSGGSRADTCGKTSRQTDGYDEAFHDFCKRV